MAFQAFVASIQMSSHWDCVTTAFSLRNAGFAQRGKKNGWIQWTNVMCALLLFIISIRCVGRWASYSRMGGMAVRCHCLVLLLSQISRADGRGSDRQATDDSRQLRLIINHAGQCRRSAVKDDRTTLMSSKARLQWLGFQPWYLNDTPVEVPVVRTNWHKRQAKPLTVIGLR